MISSEVQRTLVKSPPELWAELSDPDSLARHLGDLGEIRITRAEPEKRVEWEAEGTNGSVSIKPSGWGTKVTLSVTREIASAESQDGESDEVEAKSESFETTDTETAGHEQPVLNVSQGVAHDTTEEPMAHEPEPVGSAEEPIEVTDDDMPTAAEPEPLDASNVVGVEARPELRRGFFARLFGRRKPKPLVDAAPEPDVEPKIDESPPATAEPIASAIDALQARFQADATPATAAPTPAERLTRGDATAPEIASEPERVPDEESIAAEGEPTADLAAELKTAEEMAVEEVDAVLTATLDRLGAAHHRPFSRA